MKTILLLLLTLLPVSMMGQVKTSRLEVLQRKPLIKNGIDYAQKLFNTFKYEGNLAAEHWFETDMYAYNQTENGLRSRYQKAKHDYEERGDSAGLKVATKEYEAEMKEVENLIDHYNEIYPRHLLLFLTSPSFEAPSALAYLRNREKTELIAMKCHDNILYNITEQPLLMTVRMDVDKATLDSILNLTIYAVNTSVYRDTKTVVFDGVANYLMWRDRESKFSAEGDGMQRLLAQTYNDILKAVLESDKDKLKSLVPTIDRLLVHYRALQLPDQYINSYR